MPTPRPVLFARGTVSCSQRPHDERRSRDVTGGARVIALSDKAGDLP